MSEETASGTLLVLPSYREHVRLRPFLFALAQSVAASGLPVGILVVDDGSPDSEREATRNLCAEAAADHPCVLTPLLLPKNGGKGAAVYAGWNAGGTYGLLGFCDADGSIPPDEVIRLIRLAGNTDKSDTVIIASRHGGLVRRSPWRSMLSLIFSRWTRRHTGLGVRDTQCGCKFIPASLYGEIRPRLHETGFVFDVELLVEALRAGAKIREIPIRWTAKPGGTFSVFRDGFGMLLKVRRLSRNASRVD